MIPMAVINWPTRINFLQKELTSNFLAVNSSPKESTLNQKLGPIPAKSTKNFLDSIRDGGVWLS